MTKFTSSAVTIHPVADPLKPKDLSLILLKLVYVLGDLYISKFHTCPRVVKLSHLTLPLPSRIEEYLSNLGAILYAKLKLKSKMLDLNFLSRSTLILIMQVKVTFKWMEKKTKAWFL